MPQLFLKVDNEEGRHLKSENPLVVSLDSFRIDWLRAVRRLSSRRTQCCDGFVRHDKAPAS